MAEEESEVEENGSGANVEEFADPKVEHETEEEAARNESTAQDHDAEEHVEGESTDANGESEVEEEQSYSKQGTRKEQFVQRSRLLCCPQGLHKQTIPLVLTLFALLFTFIGSWHCSYFTGATTGFTGNKYGLWTLEDMNGNCQPWDLLFYSYSLGASLTAARALSMIAMVLGLSLMITMSQAQQFHFVSWGLGFGFLVLVIVSLATSQTYNVWTIFLLFLYVVVVLLVRALFIHPVHRVISTRGENFIGSLMIFNFLTMIFTLVVLNSDFCQCKRLSPATLEGRYDPNQDTCELECSLGAAGIISIFAAVNWLLAGAAVFKYGVQPEGFEGESNDNYGGYSRDSVRTRIIKGGEQAAHKTRELISTSSLRSASAVSRSQRIIEAENGEEEEHRRTCCQKLCCDFRITERTRSEKCQFCCFRTCLGALVFILGFAVVITAGSRAENNRAERAPDTSPNFITNVSCAFNASNTSAPFVTYPTPEAARQEGMTVAHCGACSHCSNMADIDTFVTTRKTITIEAKKCGQKAVIGSTEALDACIEERIGFTDACRKCWVDNMQCDAELCLFTCMKTLFTGSLAHNNVPISGDNGRLNWCLQCDEKRCGTAFATCSGVARRRLGIKSAIERDPAEVCPHVHFDWEQYPFPPTQPPSNAVRTPSLSALVLAVGMLVHCLTYLRF